MERWGITEQRHLGLTVSDGQEVRGDAKAVSLWKKEKKKERKKREKDSRRFGKARRSLLERVYELLTFIF